MWSGGKSYGKGQVIGGPVTVQSVAAALEQKSTDSDFAVGKTETDSHVLFVHRRTEDADLYYVDNQSGQTESFDPSFRVTGKAAELWHADTGKIEEASYSSASGRTTVPLTLAPYETVFVVFRKPAEYPFASYLQNRSRRSRRSKGPGRCVSRTAAERLPRPISPSCRPQHE